MIKQIRTKSMDSIERSAIKATYWIGSTSSLLIHTALFALSFVMYFWGFQLEKILLVVTTLVSLEAIYLSIFIQMSVNRQARKLHAVARDVEEIQEDVEEIQEDVEGIEKDVEEIQEDVEEIQEDVEEIQEEDQGETCDIKNDNIMLTRIENTLAVLMKEINELKKNQK